MHNQLSIDRRSVVGSSGVAVVLVYLLLLIAAEIAGTFLGLIAGLAGHALLIPALLSQYVLMPQAAYRRVLPALALVSIARVLSIAMAIRLVPPIFWPALAGVPLLLAIGLTARLLQLSPARLGLHLRAPIVQLAIGLTGLPLALLLHQIQPAPLAAAPGAVSIASAVMIVAAFVDELLFRGVLQHAASEVLGAAGVLVSSIAYAAMFIGMGSWAYVLAAGLIGLLFGVAVRRSNCLWGAVIAHSLLSVGTQIVLPMIF